MIETLDRTRRPLLGLSVALFAVAGASNTALDTGLYTAVAVTLVVAGCYCLARYAKQVTRKHLATTAIALWIAFLAVSGLHVVGLSSVASAVPLPADAVGTGVEAVTWATLLGAAVSTAFLGFREYARGTSTESPEDLLDGDADF